MSFIEDQINDYFMSDALGYNDDDSYAEYDDRFIWAQRQRPQAPGGVDYRYEKGGALYNG